MRITDVKAYTVGNPWKNWVFVKVETDEGVYGIGEGTVNGFAQTVAAGINELKQFILGMDPFQTEIIVQREEGCWDIIGKTVQQPVYNLMGGRCHEKVRAYANGWYRGGRTPENFHRQAKAVAARGYTALKFDPFGVEWRISTQDEVDLALDLIAAVRDAVGPRVDILIEVHSRFSVGEAIRFVFYGGDSIFLESGKLPFQL